MYEQLGLAQDDIFHKTKLLLSIYRDVVWATLSDCECVNEEIYYYGDDLNDALIYYTIVKEVLGEEWLNNELFRLGTSRLANLLLSEIKGEEMKFF